jgi:signal transduction histidine kinase
LATPAPQDVDRSRIVVVDDNLPSAELVRALLGRAGLATVELIGAPRELFDRFYELKPHLVVLDLHMPGIDGYTVLTELRSRAAAADLPILVLTADTTRDATHRALSLGANDFLTKPIDATELTLRVRNLLAGRAAHEGLLQRQRWLEASAELAVDLLSGKCPDPLHRVSELALAAADADCAVIIGPAAMRQPTHPVSAGALSQERVDGLANALADAQLWAQAPLVLESLPSLGGGHVAWDGPLLLVPLGSGAEHGGALVLGRLPSGPAFTQAERALAAGFAHQAALGVELAEAQADQERMLVLRDRHRIARDLHDHVIQRLFAAGLRLEQVSMESASGPLADLVRQHLEELDDTINEIRSTVFGLRRATLGEPNLLFDQLWELGRDLTAVLGFQPQIVVDAQPDEAVQPDIADDLLAAAREALTNVARHAHAGHADVSVRVTEREVLLEVVDDGIGISREHRYGGLMNLAERASRHGGTCRVSRAPGGGTHLQWRVPLAGAQHVGASAT